MRLVDEAFITEGESSMEFRDVDLKALDPKTRNGLSKLLQCLCGEPISIGCSRSSATGVPKECQNCQECMNWSVLSLRVKSDTLSLEELNDILLLVNQFPLQQAFFDFFFAHDKKRITFEELKAGVARFQGFAMLCFGNPRFAYRSLYNMKEMKDLLPKLNRFQYNPSVLKSQYIARPVPTQLPAKIEAEKT